MAKIIIASGPVIVEDGKVLLDISGQDDYWKFCGGKILPESSLRETAIKRAREELGIDVEIINQDPFLMLINQEKEEGPVDVLLVHWLAKRSEIITPGADVHEWAWHDLNNLPSDLGPNILPALRHFGFIA